MLLTTINETRLIFFKKNEIIKSAFEGIILEDKIGFLNKILEIVLFGSVFLKNWGLKSKKANAFFLKHTILKIRGNYLLPPMNYSALTLSPMNYQL
jgi:hypothetical protein